MKEQIEETHIWNYGHSPTCACERCVPEIKKSGVQLMKEMAERAEKKGWDLGEIDSSNYKEFLYE